MNAPVPRMETCELTPHVLNHEIWRIPKAPARLHALGSKAALARLQDLPERGIAVVGTRAPTLQGLQQTRRLIQGLRGSGLIVVSGLATGIDAAAHAEAIETGLVTIAVVATPIEKIYPATNAALRERILHSDGLILSETPSDGIVRQSSFLQRNRLIVGLTRATCVIEAGGKSGALNTAHWALETGKPCFVVPCLPGDPTMAGNERLLDGDHPEILQLWGAHSLGSVWLELATRCANRPGNKKSPKMTPSDAHDDVSRLLQATREMCSVTGGAPLHSLSNWADSAGWESSRFFAALQKAIETEELREECGLMSPRRFS